MSYANRKKKKPTKASLKKERNKALAEGDAEWNEFYAQLIEYDMEHGTYQVPVDYVVTTDDGRKLALGAWLQVQGSRLTEYARSKPQWYSDIMDLIETGKLWFDADAKRASPIMESFVLASPSAKGMASSAAKSKPASDAQKPTTSRAAPPVQSRDYAMDVDSSDDGSDNSMAQDVKRTRSSSPASAMSQPSAATSRLNQPAPSVSSHQKKTNQSSSSDKVTIPVIPEVGAKRRGRPPSSKSSGAGKAVTKRLSKSKASASHKRRKAHKDSSDEESESESASESESSAFSEGSMDWEKYAEEDYSPAEPEPQPEPAGRTKATSSSARSSATSGSSSKAPSMMTPNLSKATSSSAAASSSVEPNKSIRTSHSAFAAAVNKEREHNAAQKLLAQQTSHRNPEPSSKPLVPPTQTASKPKPVTSALTSNLPSIPPVPPVIPIPSAATSIGVNGRGPEPLVASDAGLIRPEQCLTTATGPLPPRRTLSKPKPMLAPVPTPPPPPVLTSRTAASSSIGGARSVAAPSSSTAQATRSVLPTVSSGALAHIATAPVITEAASSVPSSEISFIEKVRLMKQQKERSAAAHESPRSDVSVAGSDPPVLTEGISELTADSTSTPAAAKNGYPSPRDTYSGADGAKKRCSISEYKQSSSASKDSSTAPYQLLSLEVAQAKDSPRTATGTASDSSGSPTPDLLPGNTEALETDEKGRSNGQQQETEDEKEEDQEEDEESTVVVKGGRRGRLVHGTPRRIDDFGSSQLSQQSNPAVSAPTVPVIPTTAQPTPSSRHELEIISVDDSTTVGNVSLSATQARGVSSISEVIASAGRERAPSVLTINSDITFNDHIHEDTETSSDEDEETQGGNHRSGAQQASRQSMHRDLYSTPPVRAASDSACTTGATTNTTLTSSNPPSTTVLTTSSTTPSTALVYTLQMSDSEDESVASVEDNTNNRTKLPREDEDYVEPNAEFVAFAYTRSSTGPQYPMLGIGMVCNADDDNSNSGLYLIVMVPEGSNDPVRAEYRMDPDEFITVQRGLVLARDLSFVGGQRGGVFDPPSQAKIRTVLNTYKNLKFDTHYA